MTAIHVLINFLMRVYCYHKKTDICSEKITSKVKFMHSSVHPLGIKCPHMPEIINFSALISSTYLNYIYVE